MTSATNTVNTVNTVNSQSSTFTLRKILLLDALTCLVMGLLLVVGDSFLSVQLALPKNFILVAGFLLFPCAALMWLTSRAGSQTNPPKPLVWVVVLGNAGWVIASLLSLEIWLEPNALGMAFIALQALAVLVLAGLEYRYMQH